MIRLRCVESWDDEGKDSESCDVQVLIAVGNHELRNESSP